jgi:hypothetical protein
MGSEVGRIGTLVGYGASGTGLTGAVGPTRTRRVARNVIDLNGTAWGWPEERLITDFDSPDGSNNAMWSPTPLALEGIGAGGDSGAGVFVT